jgi:tRNA U54 and U55 pseudouridine synthase Pus10
MKKQTQRQKVKPKNNDDAQMHFDKHKCGMCSREFDTINELYRHQQDEHDPDGIMFSDLGLPK